MRRDSVIGILTLLGIIAVIVFLLMMPYFEMKAFNKFSNTKATYLDAVFSRLRVTPN